MLSCPGRSAARSDALQTRGPGSFQETGTPQRRCITPLRFMLHRVRGTQKQRQPTRNNLMSARVTLLACAIIAFAALNYPASAQTNFYEGKTVSLIVANAAGGGYDASARALARHMKKYIPGVANVIVKNMPGAGGLVAANHMYTVAEPDGLTFALLSRSSPRQPTLGFSAAKFKAENFTWLGTSSSYADSAYFLVTMAESPFQTVADLRKPGKPAQIGGLAAGGTDTDVVLVARDVLKLNLQLVRG